jgi:hypothetical protein
MKDLNIYFLQTASQSILYNDKRALSHVILSVAPPRRKGDKGKPNIENSPVMTIT